MKEQKGIIEYWNYIHSTSCPEEINFDKIEKIISKALDEQKVEIERVCNNATDIAVEELEKRNRKKYEADVPKILDKQRGHFIKMIEEMEQELEGKKMDIEAIDIINKMRKDIEKL